MELRELRIDRFGCWEDLTINSLPAGLSVIHLDDGGRPTDIVDFVYRVTYGFETDHHTAYGGALVWDEGRDNLVLDRQSSSRGQTKLHVKWNGDLVQQVDDFLDRARVSCPSDVARHVFFPHAETTPAEHWTWLSSKPQLINQLELTPATSRPVSHRRNRNRPGPADRAQVAKRTQQTQQSRSMAELKLQRLRGERDGLLRDIEEAQANLQTRSVAQPEPSPQLSIEAIQDELTMLRRREAPLEEALRLAELWGQRKARRVPESDPGELAKLRSAFSKYQELTKEKEQLQRHAQKGAPSNRRQRDRKSKRSRQVLSQIDKLLAQRSRVMDWSESAASASTPRHSPAPSPLPDPTIPDDLRCAIEIVETAHAEVAAAEQLWEAFLAEHQDDWNSQEEVAEVPRREIGPDSPVLEGSLADQLDELKRRKIWVDEEVECLLQRQRLPSQSSLWIIILFSLSVAALFGVLVVVSHIGQLSLVALGVSGIVASGALRMSLEKRAAERIQRGQNRLYQIEREIAVVIEQLWDEERAAVRRQVVARGEDLQGDLANANRRLDSAEIAFREMLFAKGISPTLSTQDILQGNWHLLRTKHEGPRESSDWAAATPSSSPLSTHPKLARWLKAAQTLLHEVEEIPMSDEPDELLFQLEQVRDTWERKRSSGEDPDERSSRRSEIQQAKRELSRIHKAQQGILRRLKVHDVFELESAIEKAIHRDEQRREWQQLNQSLETQLDACVDRSEVESLLEIWSESELEQRRGEVRDHLLQLEGMLRERRNPTKLATEQEVPSQEHLDALQSQLTFAEQNIQSAEQELHDLQQEFESVSKQAVTAETIAETTSVPEQSQETVHFRFLEQVSEGRYDSMALDRGRLKLLHRDSPLEEFVEFDSETAAMAWLALRIHISESTFRNQGDTLPLLVTVDEWLGFAAPGGMESLFEALETAHAEGLQVILLSGEQAIANQLSRWGADVLRIGLREEPTAWRQAAA